jgi:hypothetical protein
MTKFVLQTIRVWRYIVHCNNADVLSLVAFLGRFLPKLGPPRAAQFFCVLAEDNADGFPPAQARTVELASPIH